jgi:hypothetical protein
LAKEGSRVIIHLRIAGSLRPIWGKSEHADPSVPAVPDVAGHVALCAIHGKAEGMTKRTGVFIALALSVPTLLGAEAVRFLIGMMRRLQRRAGL